MKLLQVTDVGRELGRMWRELSDEGKAPFLAQAAADKARYVKEKEAGVLTH